MKVKRYAATSLAAVLIGSLAVGAAAPAHAARSTTLAAPIAAKAAKAMLTATPAQTNRGGVVTVSGSGFTPNETVTLSLNGMTGAVTTAKADAKGTLPATGISIPYSLKPGMYSVTATGATSKKTASSTITVQALKPTVTLTPPSAAPGTTETVHGTGFGRQEQVTLSLNGEALMTSPAVITTTNGAFTATFVAPSSILRGLNTISAIGNESRISTVATLTGNLARTPQFYIAGGVNDANTQSYVDLLNPNGQPASVRLTFYFDNRASYTRLVTVNAYAQSHLAVASLVNQTGAFGLQIKADRKIATQLTLQQPGHDSASILGTTGLGYRWYLATGATNGAFHESVSILNPDPATPVHVQLQLLRPVGKAPTFVTVTVPAHTNYVADINRLVPNTPVSVVAISDRPVVVERTLTFGPGGIAITARAGSNAPATNWLFASGTTENRVQTILTILNPGNQPALATATFSRANGGNLGSRTVFVPARSRAAIRLNDVVQGGGISMQVTSDQAVVVERSEYIGSSASTPAGSDIYGRNGGGVSWSFPGGNSGANSAEVLVLYNPSAVTVPVEATYYSATGKAGTQMYTLTPGAYDIVSINQLGLSPSHGAVLQSTNGQGFIAEQGIAALNSSALSATQGLAQ